MAKSSTTEPAKTAEELRLDWLAPRPRHPQADATAQAAFSQLLD